MQPGIAFADRMANVRARHELSHGDTRQPTPLARRLYPWDSQAQFACAGPFVSIKASRRRQGIIANCARATHKDKRHESTPFRCFRVLWCDGRSRLQADFSGTAGDDPASGFRYSDRRRRAVGLGHRKPARARPQEPGGARWRRSGRLRQVVEPPQVRGRRLPRGATRIDRLREVLGHAKRPLHYLAIPPSVFETVVQFLGKSGCAKNARVVVEKPFGRDLASARELNDVLHRDISPNNRSSASITISARSRCRTCCTSGLPTLFLNRSGTATTSTACRSRWPRNSASRAVARFYEEVGAIRDVIQNHMLQVLVLLAMEAPVGRRSRCDARGETAAAARDASARSGGSRARSVSRLPRRGRRRKGFGRRNLRRIAPAYRYLALGRSAVLHPRRQVLADHGHRGHGRSQVSAAVGVRRPSPGAVELPFAFA